MFRGEEGSSGMVRENKSVFPKLHLPSYQRLCGI